MNWVFNESKSLLGKIKLIDAPESDDFKLCWSLSAHRRKIRKLAKAENWLESMNGLGQSANREPTQVYLRLNGKVFLMIVC